MKIIEQSHEILAIDGLEMIERAGRTCYKSEDKIGCSHPDYNKPNRLQVCCNVNSATGDPEGCINSQCEHQSSTKFTKMLKKRGHMAMIEFGHLTVKFITNRGVTHELVRHRLCSFAQESTRYVKYDGEMEFIRPVWMDIAEGHYHAQPDGYSLLEDKSIVNLTFLNSLLDAEGKYKILLANGWRPEQAREVLPDSLKTEIVVKANFREFLHIKALRSDGVTGKPHPQMKALMDPLFAELKEICPAVFDN